MIAMVNHYVNAAFCLGHKFPTTEAGQLIFHCFFFEHGISRFDDAIAFEDDIMYRDWRGLDSSSGTISQLKGLSGCDVLARLKRCLPVQKKSLRLFDEVRTLGVRNTLDATYHPKSHDCMRLDVTDGKLVNQLTLLLRSRKCMRYSKCMVWDRPKSPLTADRNEASWLPHNYNGRNVGQLVLPKLAVC